MPPWLYKEFKTDISLRGGSLNYLKKIKRVSFSLGFCVRFWQA